MTRTYEEIYNRYVRGNINFPLFEGGIVTICEFITLKKEIEKRENKGETKEKIEAIKTGIIGVIYFVKNRDENPFLSEKNLGDISSQFTANNDKLKGLFYIIFFCFILIIGISSKEKGIIFSINYAVLFVGFVFLFAGKFFGNDWIRYAYSYAFIVSAALLWVTGILKLINNGLVNKSIKILEPTD